jgi:hypothetical protein
MVASRNFLSSLLMHAGLAVIIGFWTPMMNKSVLTDQNLPIEIITIDQFTKLVEQTAMPNKPAEKAASQPTAHEHSGAPEAANQSGMPLPDATTKQQPSDATNEASVETPRYRVAQPAPLERPTVKPKPLLDIGRVQALLNKTPDQKTADSGAPASDTNLSAGDRLTLNEVDAFRAQMRRCWSPPAGAKQAENLVVQVRLSLTLAGVISAGPVVVNRRYLGDPFFRAAAESVLRAIRRCQPFTMPAEKYASWRNIELTFDPRRMLGG